MQQQMADDKLRQLQAGLAQLKLVFIKSLPAKAGEIEVLLEQLYEGGDPEEIVEQIGQRAHKLHGQSGSFGFAHIGQQAAKLEHEVDRAMNGPRPIMLETIETQAIALLDLITDALQEG